MAFCSAHLLVLTGLPHFASQQQLPVVLRAPAQTPTALPASFPRSSELTSHTHRLA